MTVHNYRSRQVHETLNGVNPSSGFRDMRSAKSGSNLWQIWQVFGPWASPYGANGQMSMTVHNYRPRQFHRTSNGENPSSGYRDMGSASLAAARPTARPPARTVTTIPLQPGGLRGKKTHTLCLTSMLASDSLSGSSIYSTMDLASRYWQIKVNAIVPRLLLSQNLACMNSLCPPLVSQMPQVLSNAAWRLY